MLNDKVDIIHLYRQLCQSKALPGTPEWEYICEAKNRLEKLIRMIYTEEEAEHILLE